MTKNNITRLVQCILRFQWKADDSLLLPFIEQFWSNIMSGPIS